VQPKIDVDLMHARPEKDEFSPDKEFPGIDEDSGLVEVYATPATRTRTRTTAHAHATQT
jgi:hypothetical protein